jgi:protein phosphatase
MNCFGLTDPGKTRTENQDSFLIENCEKASCVILALCDGMGGANAGGLASQLSCKAFVNYVYNHLTNYSNRPSDYPRIMREACEEANGVAFAYSQFGDNLTGMGTTMVAAIMRRNGSGYVLNVGDSRAYQILKRYDTIIQITRDHSLVEDLVEYGAITKEQAKNHPQRNIITRALGSEADVEADYYEINLAAGDILILCSDGLSNIVSDEEMLDYAVEYPEPEILCRALMSKALNRGARDNVTVVVVKR